MSWCKVALEKIFLVICLLSIAACGFAPLYSYKNNVNGLNNQIRIMEIPGKDGFHLREELVRRFGNASKDAKVLDISLKIIKTDLVITPSNEITRYRLVMTANFTLKDPTGKKLISQQEEIVRTDYNSARNSTGYTAQIAEEAARKRLAVELAEQISTRLFVLIETKNR